MSDECSTDTLCQRYMGWIHSKQGRHEEAARWYLRAAVQGSSEALEKCWNCVLKLSEAGRVDSALAFCEAEPLASYLPCQRYVAKTYYAQGDMEATLQWSRKIAERGGADDLFYVANLYQARQETDLVLEYLARAAEAGSSQAHQELGEMYAFGVDVPKDLSSARVHYHEAAKKGFVLSQVRLVHIKRGESRGVARVILAVELSLLILKAVFLKLFKPTDPRLSGLR